MAEELYGEEEAPKSPEMEMEEADENTALLPKHLFPEGCKPGDKYTVEVVASYDDENEVKVLSEKKETKSDEGSMSGAESRLEGLGA